MKARLRRPINHKRLRRVLNPYDLGALFASGIKRSGGQHGGPEDLVKGHSFGTLEAFSTDFTELFYAGGQRKAYLMVLLCIESRWAGGWAVGRCRPH